METLPTLTTDPTMVALLSYLAGWLLLPRPIWMKALYEKLLKLLGKEV